MSRRSQLDAVICLWQSKSLDNNRTDWELIEAFGVDEDSHVLTETKHANPQDREPWNCWLNTTNDDEESDNYGEHTPIMGRAVTVWTFRGGVHLLDLHPPEWCRWLACGFIEEISKLPNWSSLLDCGFRLTLGTESAAKKIFLAARSDRPKKATKNETKEGEHERELDISDQEMD